MFNFRKQFKMDREIRIRDKRSGRFIGDNIIFNGYGKALGPYGLATYFCLCRFAHNENQNCYPSLNQIAEETGMGKTQVTKELDKLEQLKLIFRDRSKGGRNIRTTYYLLEPPEKKEREEILIEFYKNKAIAKLRKKAKTSQ